MGRRLLSAETGDGAGMARGGPLGGGSFRGGNVRVYGCSPGCLVMSLIASLVLTVLVNLLIRAF